MLMIPNLDATGHRWVGALASFQFELEYQKGADNGATDVLSRVPISHSRETVQSLLERAIIGAADWGDVRASEELLEEHEHLSQEVRVQVVKLAPMHIVDWEEAQEVDAAASGFISGRIRCFQSRMPFSRNAWEWRLRQNRARCSFISTIVSS